MNLEHLKQQLNDWDPASGEDLPDEVALALDDSEELRAAFDARFAPTGTLDAAEDAVPDGLADRVLPTTGEREAPVLRPGRSRWALGAQLAVAASLVGIVGVGTLGLLGTSMQSTFSSVGELGYAGDGQPGRYRREAPDAPVAANRRASDRAAGERGRRTTARRQAELKNQLEMLGYMEPEEPGDGDDGRLSHDLDASFVDPGVNGFTSPDHDRLSTFSVDVDTASYTMARRTLRSGHLPPQAAVRVEEFVNYVDYDYEPPGAGDPFSVELEAVPSPWHADMHLLRIGVQGRRVPVDQRKPVHLTFLVDTSGSMQSDDKIGLLKSSLRMLVGELQDGDTVAIVAYSGSAGVVLEPTPMSRKDEVFDALDRLVAGGSTAMGQGIEAAYRLALDASEPGAVNRVILASDGDANVGITNPAALTERIAQYADRGITLTTLGFGTGNYRDHRMEQLANDGDGNYFYIDGPDEAQRIFVDDLTGTVQVIARDVKLQVSFDPDVVRQYRLVGYENRAVADEDFRNDAVDAGEVGSGHQVTALYEVALVDDPRGMLGMLSVRSKAPGPEAPSVEQAWPLPVDAVRSDLDEATADMSVAVAAAGFAERLRGSPHASEVTWSELAELVRDAHRVEHPEDQELIELIETARRLTGER